MNKDSKVYIFRINYKEYYSKIVEELKQGRLRQGWGAMGMNVSENFKEEDFELGWKNAWGNTSENSNYIRKKYNNLRIMLEMKKGDIIIIPKVYDQNSFMITTVKDNYYFDESDDVFNDGTKVNDFRHVIPIDTNEFFESVCYSSSKESLTIKGKFRAYQSAINRVHNEDVINAVSKIVLGEVENLSDSNSYMKNLDIKSLPEYDNILSNMIKTIRMWQPDALEKIIREIFEHNGYIFEGGNRYDRQGGDIDLIFKCPVGGILEDILSISDQEEKIDPPKINIQVKKKTERDDNDIEGVNQLLKMMKNTGSDINILISTVDEFSKECEEEASKNGIILINAKNLARLILKHISIN